MSPLSWDKTAIFDFLIVLMSPSSDKGLYFDESNTVKCLW